jgi:hypothetical protein
MLVKAQPLRERGDANTRIAINTQNEAGEIIGEPEI